MTLELILSVRVIATPCPLQTLDRTQHELPLKRKIIITYYFINIHQVGREQRLDIETEVTHQHSVFAKGRAAVLSSPLLSIIAIL